MRIDFTKSEVKSLQPSKQHVVSDVHPELALIVAVTVTRAAEAPLHTLDTQNTGVSIRLYR